MGRPSTYSDALAAAVCERLMDGESLSSVCRIPGMPNKATVYRWIATRPDFLARYIKARELQEFIDQEIVSDLALMVADGRRSSLSEVASKIRQLEWKARKRNARKYRPGYRPPAPVAPEPPPVFSPRILETIANLARMGRG